MLLQFERLNGCFGLPRERNVRKLRLREGFRLQKKAKKKRIDKKILFLFIFLDFHTVKQNKIYENHPN
jgi:hypothetical protein